MHQISSLNEIVLTKFRDQMSKHARLVWRHRKGEIAIAKPILKLAFIFCVFRVERYSMYIGYIERKKSLRWKVRIKLWRNCFVKKSIVLLRCIFGLLKTYLSKKKEDSLKQLLSKSCKPFNTVQTTKHVTSEIIAAYKLNKWTNTSYIQAHNCGSPKILPPFFLSL